MSHRPKGDLIMRKLETLLVLSPELTADQREQLLLMLIEVIQREGGNLLLTDHWGMRDLAYPVQKQMRGYYVRFEYMAPATLVTELERIIRIQDGIFKFITIRLEETKVEESTQVVTEVTEIVVEEAN